jgi:hypothetical protein
VKIKSIYALAIAVVTLMVIGQVMIYGVNPYHTASSSWRVDGGIEYEISSNTSSDYDSLLIDTGMSIPDNLMVYSDSSYESYYDKSYAREKSDLLCSELSLRNVECMVVNAKELKSELEEDISSGEADARLIIQVGTLPDTIYDGSSDSIIFKWLEIGGVLYWTGHTLGRSISSVEGVYEIDGGYGMNFLGVPDKDIRRETQPLYATEESADYSIGYKLSVMYNDSTFGTNTQNLTDFISIGFKSDGYESLVLTKYHSGEGMIVVFGGQLETGTMPFIAQVIASKLTYKSEIAEHDSGRLFHSAVSNKMEADFSKNYVLYIYVGTPQIYARAFSY